MGPDDTTRLVADCLRNDDRAKAQFYSEFNGVVRRTIARRLSNIGLAASLRGEVDDITHEVFERLFRNKCDMLRRLHNPVCIHAWLVAVAGNYTVDYVRRLNARGYGNAMTCTESSSQYVYADKEAVASVEKTLDRREHSERLARCLATLSEQERLIVDLFYVQGAKYVQIAEILGLNVNTLSAKLRRAKLKLRGLLEEGGV